MLPRFEQFIRERLYLVNVTPATVEWYKYSFKFLPTESPTEDELKNVVLQMREKGLKATGCNSVFRALNAYLKWSGSSHKIPRLKEPQLVLPTFTSQQVARLVAAKPKNQFQRRLHLIVLFLLDTGCRIGEALTLRVREIDFDNMLVTLDGKGRKQRVVPFSFELRKAMFRYIAECGRKVDSLLFANRTETELNRLNVLRDVKALCRRLGFDPPVRTLHAFRHTMASNFIRRGGSVAILQRLLGHSSISTTMRYVHLQTEDLTAAHQRISLLACG